MTSMRPGARETAAAEWPYLDRTSLSAVLGISSYDVKIIIILIVCSLCTVCNLVRRLFYHTQKKSLVKHIFNFGSQCK